MKIIKPLVRLVNKFMIDNWVRFSKSIKDYIKNDEKSLLTIVGVFVFICSLIIFLKITNAFNESNNWMIDKNAIAFVSKIRNDFLSKIFIAITTTGNFIYVLIITIIEIIIIWLKNGKKYGVFLGLNILGIWLFNELLKIIFKRQRPSDIWLVKATGYSFPSGHAMIFMGLAILSIYFVIINIKKKKLAIIVSIVLYLYSILVGISRVYVGVHYFSDVFTGWIAAILWMSFNIVMLNIIDYRIKKINSNS